MGRSAAGIIIFIGIGNVFVGNVMFILPSPPEKPKQ